jgi:fibronectin-binding autotransporter adhesin
MRQKPSLFWRQHRNVVWLNYRTQLTISFLSCTVPLVHADTFSSPLAPVADSRIFNANWGWNNNDGNGADLGVYQSRDRSLIQFDFSSLPVGATVTGATLTLTASSNVYGGNPNGEAMSVYRLTQAWTEGGVTWNNYDGTNAWAAAGGDFAGTAYASSTANPSSGQTISWDVTSLANEWHTGAQANNGLMIINSGNTNGMHFVSSENGNVAARPFLATTFSTPTAAPSGAFVWNGGNGGSGAVDGSGSWSASNGFWNDSAQTWSDGNDVTFGAGSGTAGMVTVSGTVAPKSLWFTATGSGNYTITGGAISFGNATRILHTDVDATVSSDLSNGSLFKQGSAKLTLTGANTYDATSISSGTLQIGDGGTSGSLGTGAVANNGTLIFNRSDSTTFSNSISGTGAVVKNGSGTVVFNNAALTYTGGTTVNAGTLELAGSSRPSGAITVNNTGTLYSSAWSTTDSLSSLTINAGGTYHVAEGVASGGLNGGLHLNGGTFSGATGHWQYGNMRLDGNLYVGGTQQSVLSGDLRFNTTREVQVSDTGDASGIDFLVSGKIGHVNNIAWGYMNKTGDGTMKISGANELGGITVSAGKLILENSALGVMNASGLVNNAITEFAITGSNDVTWTNNSLRGSGTYVKTGTGTANIDHFNGANGNMNVVIENGKLNTLGGNNNYWAVNNTIVKSDGTLQVNTHTHIKNVTLQGGTLYAGGADATWGSLMFDNDITANGSAVSTISGTRIALANADNAIRTFTVESGSTLNITGDLENANLTTNNQLTKSGAGILTLAGSNTYTGATTVSAGTLFVTGALANSSVTVNSSGTLGGTGNIGGNLTLDAGANLDVTPGLLTITGSITLTDFSFADIIGWDAASAADGTYTLLNGGSSVTFNGNTPTLSNPYQFSSTKIGYFQQGSLQAVIATVPETSTVLLTGLGSLLLIRRRRT